MSDSTPFTTLPDISAGLEPVISYEYKRSYVPGVGFTQEQLANATSSLTAPIAPPCGGEIPVTAGVSAIGSYWATLKFKKVHALAVQPTRAHPTDSGLDLVSVETLSLAPGAFHAYDTGIQLELPAGYEGQVRPRSGLAAKKGVTVLNAPGTIDTAYTGNVKVILINHGPGTVDIKAGDRIAQLVVAPVSLMECVEVTEVAETDRGANGLGSTGV